MLFPFLFFLVLAIRFVPDSRGQARRFSAARDSANHKVALKQRREDLAARGKRLPPPDLSKKYSDVDIKLAQLSS